MVVALLVKLAGTPDPAWTLKTGLSRLYDFLTTHSPGITLPRKIFSRPEVLHLSGKWFGIRSGNDGTESAMQNPANKLVDQFIKQAKKTTILKLANELKFMKYISALALAALPLLLTSCATPLPPQAFHNTDTTALVINSLDDSTCQIVQPAPSKREGCDNILALAKMLPQHQTAVVILENYTEPQIGSQFRDRGTSLFVGLRNLGYQHIVFVQGTGGANPEGLLTLAEYD